MPAQRLNVLVGELSYMWYVRAIFGKPMVREDLGP